MDRRVLLGNLSTDVDEGDIQELFGKATGKVHSINIPKDERKGTGRGYAFVQMTTRHEAERAVEELCGAELGGRKLSISLAVPVAEKATKRKWFLFGGGNN